MPECALTFPKDDPTKSSTYKLVGKNTFSISYLSGEQATGDYISDDVNVGGAAVKSLQMGLSFKTVINAGILGVGFSNNVASSTVYPNIMDVMFAQNLTAIKAYSLWLVRPPPIP